MSQIISSLYLPFLLFVSVSCFARTTFAESSELRLPLKSLFNHHQHHGTMHSTGLSCTDCHRFSIKSPGFDPLAKDVGAGFLKPPKFSCHECHLGKVEVARVNQCSLCHLHPEKLKPANHNLAWKSRHGTQAQLNPDSCNGCHQENQNSCNNCHTQRNVLKPMVHRPNFRLTHGIEARSNPASCTTCHTNVNSCTQCHSAGVSR